STSRRARTPGSTRSPPSRPRRRTTTGTSVSSRSATARSSRRGCMPPTAGSRRSSIPWPPSASTSARRCSSGWSGRRRRLIPPGGLPGCYRTPGGRSMALFVYDGPISHDVAFGPLLKDAAAWAARLLAPAKGKSEPRLVAVATDGETYGHHHRFGEVALAWLLREFERRSGVRVENFAAFLARHPPRHDVALVAPTSWSCAHGVERWRADCGCRMAPERPT